MQPLWQLIAATLWKSHGIHNQGVNGTRGLTIFSSLSDFVAN